MEMQPGVYAGIPFENYVAAGGVSVSELKRFVKAPALARYGERDDTSNALMMGSLIHTAILEPHELERRYCAVDLARRGTKEWDKAEVRAAGRELVKQLDYDKAMRIRDAVQKHPVAREMFTPGLDVEQSMWWRDPKTGLLCRGRADAVRPEMRVILDVKTTESAHPADFGRSAAEYLYHWQAAYYSVGMSCASAWQPEAFIFIAVEKRAPYLVGAYEALPDDMTKAWEEVQYQLTRYAECAAADYWPGYSDTLEPLQLPAWAHRARN